VNFLRRHRKRTTAHNKAHFAKIVFVRMDAPEGMEGTEGKGKLRTHVNFHESAPIVPVEINDIVCIKTCHLCFTVTMCLF